jgi:hypothetical protein
MRTVLPWLAIIYAAFKFAGMVLAKGRGFGQSRIAFWDRIRAGEPGLFLAALAIAVPLVLSASAYSRRTFTGHYRKAVACYGRVTALANLPEIRRSTDGFTVYESVEDLRSSAFTTGAELGIEPGEVSRALAEQAASFGKAYDALQRQTLRQGMSDQIELTLRCLHPPPAPPNA